MKNTRNANGEDKFNRKLAEVWVASGRFLSVFLNKKLKEFLEQQFMQSNPCEIILAACYV